MKHWQKAVAAVSSLLLIVTGCSQSGRNIDWVTFSEWMVGHHVQHPATVAELKDQFSKYPCTRGQVAARAGSGFNARLEQNFAVAYFVCGAKFARTELKDRRLSEEQRTSLNFEANQLDNFAIGSND